MTVKQYKTTAPKNGRELAIILHGDETWHLYVLQTARRSHIEWKLASLAYVANKAAYWFSWDTRSSQLVPGRCGDLATLRAYRPALHRITDALVQELVSEHGDPRLIAGDWEPMTYAAQLEQSPAIPAAGDSLGIAGDSPATDQSPVSPPYPHFTQGDADTGLGVSPARDQNTGDPDGDLL